MHTKMKVKIIKILSTILLILQFFILSWAQADDRTVDLTVDYKTVNFTGIPIEAITVNNQIPAPTLRFKEGDNITINIHNHLDKGTTIHWHGILLPWQMDGVEGITQKAIAPGCQFQYQFTLKQSGTYWYHAHAGLQEQQGVYGAFVIEPKTPPDYTYTKDYTIVLSDWSNTEPDEILANLKKDGDYYSPNFPLQPSLTKFIRDYKKSDCTQRKKLIADYKMMQTMRMNIYDFSDVAYDAFLLNGQTRCSPWTASVSVGDTVRLRFIGAAGSTNYHVKIPGIQMKMVHVQGNDIEPYFTDDFTITPGETYDVLVKISKNKPYYIYAESADTLGAAVGALVPTGPHTLDFKIKPFPEPQPVMMGMDHGSMHMDHSTMKMDPKMDMSMTMGTKYQNLKSTVVTNDPGKPVQEIKMVLSGYMGKYIWFINDVPEYLAKPIIICPDKRYRLIFTNTSMMHHPMHLHGHWLILRNGHGAYDPKLHTIDVAPGSTAVADFDANANGGQWFFHCHHIYHMMSGMARVFRYAGFDDHELMTAHAHPQHYYSAGFLDIGIGIIKNTQAFSFEFLFGSDYNKLQLFANDAEIRNGIIETADLDVFYWHSISEFWAIKGGINYVYRPATTPYLQPGIGIEGLMPYFINTDIRLYYHNNNIKLDIELARDTQITNNFFIRTGFRSIFGSEKQLRYTLRPYYRLGTSFVLFTEYEYERDYETSQSTNRVTAGLTFLF